MNKQICINIIFLILISSSFGQEASNAAGTASNLFLRTELSARASALAGSFTAISDDENAIFYNPAGLANIRRGAFGFNHTQWFEDINMDNIIFGYNFDRKLGIGLSLSHMWMSPIQGKDYRGEPTEKIDVSSSIICLGLGYRVHPSIFVGINVKYFQDNLADYSADGIALDAGFYMYTFVRGLTFGMVVQNIGGDIQYDVEQEKLPLTYRAGLAYKTFGTRMRIAIDVVKSIDSDLYYTMGVEYIYAKMFSLRIGNQFQNQDLLKPSFGAGLNIFNNYLIDYTFFSNENLGATHKIGFTFRFDIPSTHYGKKYRTRIPAVKELIPPVKIVYEFSKEKLIIKWSKVYGAQYNVYARISRDKPWKKINRKPLYANQTKFKKPKHRGKYLIAITSVIDNTESSFSNEVEINVK